ncbi:hypothetical protein DL93DRAFT_289448 [Clavulina sp. PMI_390]|nr:hypothetical protein DL93DRAFT_289448 [Clavulina sp. PMI_390]
MGDAIRSNVSARYWVRNHPMTRSRNSSATAVQRSPQSSGTIASASSNTLRVSTPKLEISDEIQGPLSNTMSHFSDNIKPNPPILLENTLSTPSSVSSAGTEPTISTPIATSSLTARQAIASLALRDLQRICYRALRPITPLLCQSQTRPMNGSLDFTYCVS